ncbi:uncharacterized protein LDX57_001153 [Aspergillus melleus]|uniref:uncharacterized protein n=1 Tax=Aspergillus melleus TaxID=138277 RepID=UPI001E8DF259|nr:uncharacterized protein LDX57_001153 [Aspergillus melleus]KAH8423395.1 hypothetical protein LDX57_001153 [Aspergillus melleus]
MTLAVSEGSAISAIDLLQFSLRSTVYVAEFILSHHQATGKDIKRMSLQTLLPNPGNRHKVCGSEQGRTAAVGPVMAGGDCDGPWSNATLTTGGFGTALFQENL